MTNKQAQITINAIKFMLDNAQYSEDVEEALNMAINALTAQPELTDVQAIEHLQESGWMQNHDKQMYEMGLREQLADDSDSYDALLPPAQQGRKTGTWITVEYYADGKPAYREWKCSACGCVVEDEKPTWNFCPMCGADMRSERDMHCRKI